LLTTAAIYFVASEMLPNVKTSTFVSRLYLYALIINVISLTMTIFVISLHNVASPAKLDVGHLRSIFKELDTQKQGELNLDQVAQGLRLLDLADTDYDAVFEQLDVDESGLVSLDEWMRLPQIIMHDDHQATRHNFVINLLVRWGELREVRHQQRRSRAALNVAPNAEVSLVWPEQTVSTPPVRMVEPQLRPGDSIPFEIGESGPSDSIAFAIGDRVIVTGLVERPHENEKTGIVTGMAGAFVKVTIEGLGVVLIEAANLQRPAQAVAIASLQAQADKEDCETPSNRHCETPSNRLVATDKEDCEPPSTAAQHSVFKRVSSFTGIERLPTLTNSIPAGKRGSFTKLRGRKGKLFRTEETSTRIGRKVGAEIDFVAVVLLGLVFMSVMTYEFSKLDWGLGCSHSVIRSSEETNVTITTYTHLSCTDRTAIIFYTIDGSQPRNLQDSKEAKAASENGELTFTYSGLIDTNQPNMKAIRAIAVADRSKSVRACMAFDKKQPRESSPESHNPRDDYLYTVKQTTITLIDERNLAASKSSIH
jgi:hypothetical protein